MTGLMESEASPETAASEATPAPLKPNGGVVTLALIGINVAVFAVMVLSGVPFFSPNGGQVLGWGADFGPMTTSGQWWRLVTACFLHFGIIHIAMNMYVLFQIGVFTEMLFGRARFLVLYMLAGIAGNVAGLYLHPFTISAGASGAIFGLYGGLLAFLLVRRGVVPIEAAKGVAKSAGIFLAYNLIYGMARAGTDMEAHIGGLLSGFVFGAALAWSLASPAQRAMRFAAAAAVSCGALMLSLGLLPRGDATQGEWFRQMVTGSSITVGDKGRLVYVGSATKADAERMGQALLNIGFFKKPGVAILLSKGPGGASLSIPLDADETQPESYPEDKAKFVDGKTVIVHDSHASPYEWNDPAFLASLKLEGPQLATAAGGPPLTLKLLNGKGQWRRDVKIDAADVRVGTQDHITYSGEATADQAKALGERLQAAGYFRDRGAVVMFAKSSAGTELYLAMQTNAWNNPRTVAEIEKMAHDAGPAMGGLPVTVHLVNASLEDEKDLLVQ